MCGDVKLVGNLFGVFENGIMYCDSNALEFVNLEDFTNSYFISTVFCENVSN